MVWPFPSSSQSDLTLGDALNIADECLENSRNAETPAAALSLCMEAEKLIEHAAKSAKAMKTAGASQNIDIANAYHKHAELLEGLGHMAMAQKSHKNARKWGYVDQTNVTPLHSGGSVGQSVGSPSALANMPIAAATLPLESPYKFFSQGITFPVIKYELPEVDGVISSTPQLAFCLSLLDPSLVSNDTLSEVEKEWSLSRQTDQAEQDRIRKMATDLIREFIGEEVKNPDIVSEVVSLSAVLDQDESRTLLQVFLGEIKNSLLLQEHLLDGLAHLMRNAVPDSIQADDLVKVLELLTLRLKGTHQQSSRRLYQLTLAISHVLDSMMDSQVKGLSHEQLHAPLSEYLEELQDGTDPTLSYQAAYAYQALQYIPDDENVLKSMLQRTGKVVRGISGLVSAVKALDLSTFVGGLQDIHEGVAGAVKMAAKIRDAPGKTIESTGSPQDWVGYNRRSVWYPALRGIDSLIQDGRLSEIGQYIYNVPCRHDTKFLRGVCQRLGEIASSKIWDSNTRECAVRFLGQIYNDIPKGDQEVQIQNWIRHILRNLVSASNTAVAIQAQGPLQELTSDSITDILDESSEYEIQYQTKITVPPQSSPLLDCIQDRYNVVSALRQLRHERLEARNVDIYISPRAKANMLATEDFDLTLYAQEFLSSNKKVFLLLGESGVGKSTFNQALEMELWDKFDVKTGRIPLFIYLPMIENPEYNLVEKHLSNIGFSAAQIHELKAHREFILICDGFDESQQQRNIYKSNQMNQPHSWRAQMVIGCRLEYNGIDYRELYKPTNRNKTDELNSFQEAVMTPFNKTQIHDYINQYVQSGKSTWQTEDYLRALREIQNLQDLVTNPFLLKLALEVLPSLIDSNAGFTSARITRIELYDEFVFQWIERSRVRFRDMELDDNDKEALQNIVTTGFKDRSIKYLKDLASSIYQHQNGKPAIQYSEPKDQDTWKESFFGDRGDNNLLKTTIPLIRNGIQYRFIHKSVLEYGLALSIYDPFSEENDNEPLMPALSRRNSLDSVRSFEMDESSTTKNNIQEQPPTNSTLLNRNLVKEPSVVQFLSERVNKSSSFKQQLLAAVEQSKRNKEMRTAASNAITILIRAGVQFIGADLRGIQIPGADLSYGMFDSAQLSSTDLRKANLRNVWLREASLNEARMDGAQFGELPYLSEEDNVQACSYSLDGKSFAAGIANGGISLYEVPDWKKKLTLKGHTNEVSSISFSANGDQIVSGSNDKTVRVWDVSTGNCLHTLQDHSEPIKCVVFSPQGGQIASGSDDSTVRVWDAYTGNCLHILQGHSFWVNIVVYSPQGDRIASGSMDNTARVWDVSTGECLHVLEGHSDWVRRVVYSPQGDQIATGSDDSTVRVWDASTGNCLYSLRDHKDWVMGVVYSPQGDRIATASRDKTVRVWDVSNGNCLHTLHGHSLGVNSVVYSPHGDQIASGSMDCTIRVWDVSTGDCLHSLQGHTSGVSCVVYSPEGNQLASGSSDKTVRVWDISAGNLFQASQRQSGWIRESLRWAPRATYSPRGDQIASGRDDNSVRVWDVSNGDCLQILQGHSDKVWSIVYSPEGDQITTGSLDNTARVWDASTGKCIHLLQGHSGEVRNVVYSPKGDRIATGSLDFTLRLWDVSTGNCLHTLEGHSSWVRSLAYSPLGNHIASGSSDSTVRVWDAYTGNCLHILQGHTSGVPCVVYSPQGNQIASGSFDYTVRVWDISTGECLHALQGHKHWVQTVVYSPQGDQITSGSDDKTIRVWDISTGNCLHTLDGHKDVIRDIVYSPKGDQIASGSDDGTVRVWSIDNGSCLLVMSGFHGPVSSVIFTSSWLITCSVDSSVRCWELSVKSDAYKVGLCWSTSHGALMVSGANLIGAKGLIRMNTLLLGQRGALLGITDNEE